ncbi:MAG TPA: PapB/FocB family fimbrial expression transcriptional regulator [Scandinavium sp.]|jgi:hypothetical protein
MDELQRYKDTPYFNLRNASGVMNPGEVNIQHFRLLMMLCPVRNPAMQKALEDVFVHGITRKEACLYCNVAQSHFSIKYRQFQFINQVVARISPYLHAQKPDTNAKEVKKIR